MKVSIENTELTNSLRAEFCERAPSSAIGNIVLCFILSYQTYHLDKIPTPFKIGACLVLFGSMFRFITARSPKRDCKRIMFFTAIGGMGWFVVLSTVFLSGYFDQSFTNITLLILSGLASSALFTLAPIPFFLNAYLIAIFVAPTSIAYILGSPKLNPTFLTLVIVYFFFLHFQSRTYFSNLVKKFTDEFEIQSNQTILRTVIDVLPGNILYFDSDLKPIPMYKVHRPLVEENNVLREKIDQFSKSNLQHDQIELEIFSKNQTRWHLVSMSKTEQNRMVCVLIDIHDEKTAEMEAKKQKARTEHTAKLASLGEISAGIAHEINNPLTVIKGKSQHIALLLQRNDHATDKVIYDTGIINQMVNRIASIVRGLKVFARDASEDPFLLSRVNTIIDDTLTLCKSRFSSRGIQLDVDLCDDQEIECRATQISQVLLNLLSNAFDAVEALNEKWVKITTLNHDTSIEIQISDSGPGISSELQDKIFQPFYTTKEVGKGTGLGLSISSGIIKSHSGELFVDTVNDHTLFTVILPKKQS